MSKKTTLTAEELQNLQNLQTDFTKAKVALGDIELKKYELLKQIDILRNQFSEQERALISIYGQDSVINMQTGEVTKKEK